ncbi:hypothetical protein CHS0354_010098, partial [Potamilus streckersoni]
VFVLFQSSVSSKTEYCSNLDGTCCWTGKLQNKLGSTMEITTCHEGSLSGKYNSSVGQAKASYDLAGRYTTAVSNNKDYIVGFSVAWNNTVLGNSQSTTSWTGIYYASEGIIHTHWILTSYRKPDDLWATNQIGHNDFKRI